MMIPAVLKYNLLKDKFREKYYSKDMFYVSGDMNNWIPDIDLDPYSNNFQYAIIDKNDNLIGYFAYSIDWYASNAYAFSLISFDKGNVTVAFDVRRAIKKIINFYKIHRAEFCVVCGNPVEKHYDKFCRKYNGSKYILHDCIKTADGEYRNKAIYEIIFNNKEGNKR